MAQKLAAPRALSAHEKAVVLRVLEVGMSKCPSTGLLESVHGLIVQDECDCGCDAIFFENPTTMGHVLAHAMGIMANGDPVELLLWEYGGRISFLELEPLTYKPARLPVLSTIVPLPEDFHRRDWWAEMPRPLKKRPAWLPLIRSDDTKSCVA